MGDENLERINAVNKTIPLLNLELNCDAAVAQITQQMVDLGFRVIRSFDLQSACASYPSQVCPHHGDAPCDCQLVVLLVYGPDVEPASLVIHSHRGQTEIALVDSPGNRPGPIMEEFIRLALSEENFYLLN